LFRAGFIAFPVSRRGAAPLAGHGLVRARGEAASSGFFGPGHRARLAQSNRRVNTKSILQIIVDFVM
jgi:hypothetical protein